MVSSSLSRVGNSSAVFIPAALRRKAGVAVGDRVTMDSPRNGVIVLTFPDRRVSPRLAALDAVERRIQARSASAPAWGAGMTADELIEESKEARFRELTLA